VDADAARRGGDRAADRVRERGQPAAGARQHLEREVGIRAALGAGRWRLVRQLLVESLVLDRGNGRRDRAAWWAVQILKNSMPEGVARISEIALDLRVLAAAAGLSIVTGILFGIVPALQLSKPDLGSALKEGSRGAGTGAGRQRLRSALVVAEVALAVVLLVGAALFIGSFITLMRIDPGFNPENVLTVQVSPRFEPGAKPADYAVPFAQIVDRVSQIPGVVHASMISGGMPLGGSMSVTTITVPGRKIENDQGISIRRVTPEYHKALRIPLRSGRLFDATDRQGSPNVVIINESAAKKYFPGENPIGRSANINNGDRTIVGVVGDVYQSSLEIEPRTEAYVPMSQLRVSFGELVIRTSGDPYDILPAVKPAVLNVLPDVPLRNVRTMEELISRRVAQRRLNMLLLGLFDCSARHLRGRDYGVMAYIVPQRTRGSASGWPWRDAWQRRRDGADGRLRPCRAGIDARWNWRWYLTTTAKTLKTFLFRLDANDPRAFGAALVVLALAALVASIVPRGVRPASIRWLRYGRVDASRQSDCGIESTAPMVCRRLLSGLTLLIAIWAAPVQTQRADRRPLAPADVDAIAQPSCWKTRAGSTTRR
jgi:putative ABC transport system permease protein